jgi:hypothetical protein
MERAAWTDQRLDDLAEAMRSGFARLDQDIRDVRGEIATLRDDMNAGFAEQRAVTYRLGGGLMVALIGVIAAILAQGA